MEMRVIEEGTKHLLSSSKHGGKLLDRGVNRGSALSVSEKVKKSCLINRLPLGSEAGMGEEKKTFKLTGN